MQARGLKIIDLSPAQVQRAFSLKALHAALSAYDCFSRALAEALAGAMLLLITGDQQLRRRAKAVGVEVHGVLWISDQIEHANKLTASDLADALERLANDPLVFLPSDEVKARIARLRKFAGG